MSVGLIRAQASGPDTLLAHEAFMMGASLRDSGEYRLSATQFVRAARAFEASQATLRSIEVWNEASSAYRLSARSDSAWTCLAQAKQIIARHRAGFHPSHVHTLYQEAALLYTQQDYVRAQAVAEDGLSLILQHRGERHPLGTHFQMLLGVMAKKAGAYDLALAHYQAALERARQDSLQYVSSIAILYNNIGIIHKIRTNYPAALAAYHQSLQLDLARYGPNHPALGRTYQNLSNLYRRMADYRSARQYSERAIELLRKRLGLDHPDLAQQYYTLSILCRREGSVDQAIAYLQRALDLTRTHFGEEHPDVAMCYGGLGNAWIEKGDYQQALQYQLQALALNQKLNPGHLLALAIDQSNLAQAYMHLARYEEAFTHYRQALTLRRQFHGDIHPMVAKVYFNLAACHMRAGQRAEQIQCHTTGLEILSQAGGSLPVSLGRSYTELAYSRLQDGDLEQALLDFQSGLQAVVPGFEARDPRLNPGYTFTPSEAVVLDIFYGKASAWLQRAHEESAPELLDAALEALWQGINWTGQIRRRYPSEAMQMQLSQRIRHFYSGGVGIAQEAYQLSGQRSYLDLAFQMAENGKAFTLMAATRHREALRYAGVPEDWLEKERALQLEMAYFRKRLLETETSSAPDSLRSWQKQLFERQLAHDVWVKQLEKVYPEYFALKYAIPTLKLEELQGRLPTETCLLQYIWGEEQLWVFCITAHSSELLALQVQPDSLHLQIQQLRMLLMQRDQIEQAGYQPARVQAFARLSHALYRQVLAPALERLSAKPRHLMLVPDGELHYLPFDLLLTSLPLDERMQSYRKLPYLLKQYSSSSAHSAHLALDHPLSDPGFVKGLGVFVPHTIGTFAQLPYSISEAEALSRLMSGSVYQGDAATETNFKRLANQFQMLHLATHAYLHEDPLYSGLVFQRDSTEAEDGVLEAFEIYEMNLEAELVVLSACNTGLGPLVASEGLISLARAFRYAGCPSIVMSLWQAEDQATAGLMSRFYYYLQSGYSKSEALRQAKLDQLRDGKQSHPHYWGGFVLVGNTSPVSTPWAGMRWWLILLLLVLAAGGAWFFFQKGLPTFFSADEEEKTFKPEKS